ncbi:Uncharacterized protein dnm_058550 [Desulfonema magnum]|uniref:Uncharacterized protein n=1 Tax=Desulfonema magnum TaxID=45655 RepID=A0A975BQK5_9BACT|nr:Uncharacterized protein dnm_058550 [Desulfonema magnum]
MLNRSVKLILSFLAGQDLWIYNLVWQKISTCVVKYNYLKF